jgi:hypothetical protein
MHQNSSETPPAAATPPPQSFVTSKADDDQRASMFSPNRETKTKVLLADYYSQRGIDSRKSKKKSSSRATGVLLLFVVIATLWLQDRQKKKLRLHLLPTPAIARKRNSKKLQ